MTNEKIILKRFYSLLKKNDALPNFLYNIKQYNNDIDILTEDDIINFFIEEIKTKHGRYIVDNAFTWSSTYEGFAFWSKLDDEWRYNVYPKKCNGYSFK
jgi:hypothetical protein